METQNQNISDAEFIERLNSLTSIKKNEIFYNSMKKDPSIFYNLKEQILNSNYSIRSKEEALQTFDLIPALCQLYNETNDRNYGDVVAKMIELLFFFPDRSELYLSQLLDLSQNNNICKNFNFVIVKNMFAKQLEILENYRTQFYNTNIPNIKPFVTILIIGHGKDLLNSLPINENTNTLMFNLSSVPNIVSARFKDDEVETIMNSLTNILKNKPNRYIDIINNLTEFKQSYIFKLNNMSIKDNSNFLAKEYSKYACRVTKPTKNKKFNFTNMLNPGIYVISCVNLNINITKDNEYDRLINLLIPEDLMYFNELFGKDQDYGSDIFKTSFNEFYQTYGFPEIIFNNQINLQLQTINSYFNDLGIQNVGYIDFSCRGSKEMSKIDRHSQMVIEEMGASNKCGQFPVFGGAKHKGFSKDAKNKGKNKSKKNKKSIKRNKC